MDSSQATTTAVQETAEPTTTVTSTSSTNVDPTIPDGDAIDTLTPPTNSVRPTTTTTTTATTSRTSSTCACLKDVWKRLVTFYWDYEFLVLVVLSIALARAYPPLGAQYLAKEITASWIAVIFIFVLCGLSLKTEEFSNAFKQLKFNIAVQVFNFGVVSSVVFGVSRALIKVNAISEGLGNGMVICSSVPLTINMVIVLIKSSGGDEATAIFNSAFANMIGVFLSPALILGYLGVSASIDLGQVFLQVALRVILPVIVGQLLRKFSPTVVTFAKTYKPYLSAAQQYCLIFIVYTVFCQTFANANHSATIGDIFTMIAVEFALILFFLTLSWHTFRFLVPESPKLRVTAVHACVHKTVAMGIPLISAIYGKDPLVGLYTLPLLVWHSLQLVIGSLLAPRLAIWVKQEQARLGLPTAESEVVSDDDDDESVVAPGDDTDAPVATTTTLIAADDDVERVPVEEPPSSEETKESS